MDLRQYIREVGKLYKGGRAGEHSYRPALEKLISSLMPHVKVINEPKLNLPCGKLDYALMTKDDKQLIGCIEAKDVGTNLNDKKHQGQFMRYREALDNLIITDYLTFQFFHKKELVDEVQIATIEKKAIKAREEEFVLFKSCMANFCDLEDTDIHTTKALAQKMASEAIRLREKLAKALNYDKDKNEDTDLIELYEDFKKILVPDLPREKFADMCAQTLAYGLFVARLHYSSGDFTRAKAATLIPKSTFFLRRFFDKIAGNEIDERIEEPVNKLAKIFEMVDVAELWQDDRKKKHGGPTTYFYEDFLEQYDHEERKKLGVYYTPLPVVQFITRGVDDILKKEFGLKEGLADRSKISFGTKDKKEKLHRVQILDPATGTGTFLAEIIKRIYEKNFVRNRGAWPSYVKEHLLPRLHGFELLMASYAMAHLKMTMILKESGYKLGKKEKLNIFLTNALEELQLDTQLSKDWFAKEAEQANRIKNNKPIMVVTGNPPYLGESKNKGWWIMQLMDDYKKEPDSEEKLGEKNPKWINDDYVKFMRYGEHFIERNGEGILAYINPHGFLDNPTFRGMRWHLLQTFDDIYILDVHGNAKKKEKCPDGSKDENVFDIQQGVSINFLVKTGKKREGALAQIHHHDLYGVRESKYQFLAEKSLGSIPFKNIPHVAPMYFMVQKDFAAEQDYNNGFGIKKLFSLNAAGIVTARDNFTIHPNKEAVTATIDEFLSLDDENARAQFNLGEDKRDWKVHLARQDLEQNYPDQGSLTKIAYRPFDDRWTFFTGKSRGIHCMPRGEVMRHFLNGENIGLIFCRQVISDGEFSHAFVTNKITEGHYYYNELNYVAPLYLYHADDKDMFKEKRPNLDAAILKKIEEGLGIPFVAEAEAVKTKNERDRFSPLDVLEYIYAVLHAPAYRLKYREFLKIDFPRVPYPQDATLFWQLVEQGGALRRLHLLEQDDLQLIIDFEGNGDNQITNRLTPQSGDWKFNPKTDRGRIYINETQYFGDIPRHAWEFYIGGYQPAQKWLKDRKGEKLSFDDIEHYRTIISVLDATHTIMRKIDKIKFM